MILAGEIGATGTRVAAFDKNGSKLQLAVVKTYPSQQYTGLSEIVSAFIKAEGIAVHTACFAVAGPVRRGRSNTECECRCWRWRGLERPGCEKAIAETALAACVTGIFSRPLLSPCRRQG